MNYVPSGAGDVLGRTASANDESHGRVGQFRMRPIGHRLRLTIECHVLAVGHDADNFARHVLVFHVNRHALANWVSPGRFLRANVSLTTTTWRSSVASSAVERRP